MKAAAWSLRQASPADLDAILALELTLPETPHWSRAAWISSLSTDPTTTPVRAVFLAEEQTRLVGFAVASIAGLLAELENVVVAAEFRRQGIGKALCQQAVDWSRQLGAHTIELEVRASSAGAIALYHALGFQQQGRRAGYYRNPPDDAVLMAASL